MIIYNNRNSFTDFDLYISEKNIPVPERKQITETVPYMSGLWDFSFLDGVDEYDAITLVYSFDVIGDSKQELNEQKTALIAWLHEKTDDNRLFDTDISNSEYYEVYQVKTSWSEEGLQGLLTAEFLCYPFRKSPAKTLSVELTTEPQTIIIENKGARPIIPIITVEETATISDGANNISLGAGAYNHALTLKRGNNTLTASGSGVLRFTYWAEVLA